MQVAAVPAATCIGCGPQPVRAAKAAKPFVERVMRSVACRIAPGRNAFGVWPEHFLGLGAHRETAVPLDGTSRP